MDKDQSLAATFGRLLRELREERGLSQMQLALESELDQTFISLLERGKRQPSLATLFALSAALEVGPDALVRKLVTIQANRN